MLVRPVQRALGSSTWRVLATRHASVTPKAHTEQMSPSNNNNLLLFTNNGRLTSLVQVRNFSAATAWRAPEVEAAASTVASAASSATSTVASATSAAVKPDELVVDFVIPDRPVPIVEQVQQAVEAGQSLAEPTFQSLGLASYWPAGWMQSCLEYIHISGGLPWWSTILVTTVGIRLFVFPLVVYAQKNSARISNHSPGMQKISAAMSEARQRGDLYEAERLGMELQEYNKRHDLNPIKGLLPVFLQLPIFMSMFFGLRGMCNLPVQSMETGGLWWFSDLTAADPYMLLPMMTALSLHLQFRFAADGINVDQMGPIAKGVMKVFPVLLIPITMNFPSAITFYWGVTNLISVAQARFIRIEAVRTALGVPLLIKWDKQKMGKIGKKDMKFMEAVRDGIDNWKVQSEAVDRRAFDEQQFREAGLSRPKRTYKFDPTAMPARRK